MAVTARDGALEWKVGFDTSQLKKQIDEVNNLMTGIGRKAEDQADKLDSLARKAAAGLAAYLSVNATTNFIKQMVTVRGEFQQLEVAFNTMLGSKEKADKLLQEVTEFAATTPYGLQEVASATKQLLAFGIEANKIKDTLRQLGDVAAGLGQPIGEIAYLYGTIKTAGVANSVDIKQFAQRGIPIYEELAKVLKVNVEEVNNLVSAGKVGFPEIEKVFQSLTAEGSRFGGLMEAQSKTLTGQISNLRDAVDQMFNALGKQGEGVFAGTISALTYLVENFQSVIDIIKVLVVTYGAYRAAIILTNAAMIVQQDVQNGLTIAQSLHTRAVLIGQKAMAFFNTTLLKNPAALVIAGLTGLITALVLFNRSATAAEKKQQLLNDVNADAAKSVVAQKESLQSLLKVAQDETFSKERRLKAVQELNKISPEYLGNLTLENLKTKEGVDAINKYIKALDNLALAKAAENKKVKLGEDRIDLQQQYDAILKDYKAFAKANPTKQFNPFDAQIQAAQEALTENENSSKAISELQRKATEEQISNDDKQQKSKKRTLEVIDEEIKAEKDRQQKFSASSKEYQDFQKKINTLEAERKAITGASKSEIKSATKAEDDRNAVLQKRIDFLQKISDLERDSKQTGLSDQEKAVDQVNQKYDQQLLAIKEVNAEIEKFNKRNRKSPIALLGSSEENRINAARSNEVNNIKYKDDAEKYLKSLDDRKKAFDEFTKAVDSGNSILADSTRKTYEKELGGFDDYLSLLKNQYDELFNSLNFDGSDNIGDVQMFEGISKRLEAAQKESDEKVKQNNLDNLKEMLSDVETFNKKRFDINEKYNKLEATLNEHSGEFSPSELEARKKAIKEGREEELKALENEIARQSGLYKKLNEDIIKFTRQQIKERIKLLKEGLKTDTTLTPQMKSDIQAGIDQYEGLLDSTNETAKEFEKLSKNLGDISGMFSSLGGALEGLNDDLADTLNTLGEIASVGANAASAISNLAKGDYVAAAGSIVQAVVGVFSIGKKVRESRIEAQKELQAFQDQVLKGEIDVNQLYRQRALEQAKINTLKLEGLKKEADALRKNADDSLKDYQKVLSLLQGESAVAGQRTESYGGVFGIGRKTRVVDELQSLTGLNYDQLEKLFIEGRLTGRARELFETLQKLKQEGLDIEQQMADAKAEADEIFTATTSESIADAIIQGIESGGQDAANTFEDMMKKAILNSLKYKYLEGPIKDFFAQFSADAESGGSLTAGEIDRLRSMYNSILSNANTQFQQLQDIANLNFSDTASGGNSLTGAIKGMTEQQAELLAGQFGGLRLTALDQLNVARQGLQVWQNIEINTAKLHDMHKILRDFQLNGIHVI